jgi:o-succinylbenzoate synthase
MRTILSMRVRTLCWTAFQLPFRDHFATARGALTCREGIILQLCTDTGIVGVGEAAPISNGNQRSLPDVFTILTAVQTSLDGKPLEAIGSLLETLGKNGEQAAMAAVRCAFDVAICDIKAQAAGIPVAEFLTPHPSRLVPVNATIGASKPADAYDAAVQARKAGFRCIKLKIGMAASIEAECERVAAVRDAFGYKGQLRLDANGTWTIEQAIRTIQALQVYDLEYIEQPIGPGDLVGLRSVQEAVQVPIAVDEDITSFYEAERVLQLQAAQVLILKPMVIGGLQPTRQIIEQAQTAGASVVVTTSIDSGVGTAAALHLAATLPPGGRACGLATGSLLAADLITSTLVVRNGYMELPEQPGLGVTLDEEELCQYRRN